MTPPTRPLRSISANSDFSLYTHTHQHTHEHDEERVYVLHPSLLALRWSSQRPLDLATTDIVFEPGDFDVKRVQFLLDLAQFGGSFDFFVVSRRGGFLFFAVGSADAGLRERGFELGQLGSLGHREW